MDKSQGTTGSLSPRTCFCCCWPTDATQLLNALNQVGSNSSEEVRKLEENTSTMTQYMSDANSKPGPKGVQVQGGWSYI